MNTFRSITLALIGALLLAVGLAGGWLFMDYTRALAEPLSIEGEPVLLAVAPGETLNGIARALSQRGVIAHPHYLVWEARRQGTAARIKAGEYQLEPGLTPRELLDKLVRGKVLQRTLTLVEGWNFADLLAAVRSSEHLTHTLARDAANAAVMERLGFPEQHPEGRFYPDTYHFPRGTTDAAFLRRAHSVMAQRLAQKWREREEGLPYDTPIDALILASIIEKETGKPEERTRIAGVFVRRLKRGMRLQSDPTVIYGMGASFTGNIRRSDLKRPTPYNTYTIRGLPPTPIAMPGEAAIHAALHPAKGKALYFVAKGDGGHQFSATLAEHNRAVAHYQSRWYRNRLKNQ